MLSLYHLNKVLTYLEDNTHAVDQLLYIDNCFIYSVNSK